MVGINFKFLVENELNKTLGSQIMALLTIPGDLTLEKCAIWASLLDRTGVSYLKIDTLLSLRPGWPIIDTLFYIFKVLQNANVIGTISETDAKTFAKLLNESYTVKDFYKAIIKIRNKSVKESKKIKLDPVVLEALQDKINYLLQNYNDYRDYSSTKLKQITDKTQILAAENYLNLTPYDAVMRLLKEYGGYDLALIKNILYYPGETRYTQRSNIEGPVMGSIVEISKLMLLFYREYIIEQKEANGKSAAVSVVTALDLKDINDLKNVVDSSAGKLSSIGDAGKKVQNDYKNFVHGKSALTIDPSVPPPIDMPMDPPKPAIEKIADFRNISGTSQDVYQAFLSLFNNIRAGTHPSKWAVAGKIVSSGVNLLTGLLGAVTAFSGHKLYGSQ